jgi:hypothetical protein
MKLFKLLVLVIFTYSASAQVKVTILDKKSIPASIHYIGNIINAARYVDKEGVHILITTATGVVPATDVVDDNGKIDTNFSKADLYAYNYIINGNKTTVAWQMHDFAITCPVTVRANYIPGAFALTDLNKDGVAEVWLMYITGCNGDPSPTSMKIIMHEGTKKYAVRGSNRVTVPPLGTSGGEYKLDEAFKNGPEIFRQYALQLWKKNIFGR